MECKYAVSIDPVRHGSSPHMDSPWHLSCPSKLAPLLCLLGLNFGAQKQAVLEKICASAHTPTDKFHLISALNNFHRDLFIDSFLLSGFVSARKKLKKAAKRSRFRRIDLSSYAENEIIEVDISSDSDEPHAVPRPRLLHSSIRAIEQICNLSTEVNYIYSFKSSSNLNKSPPDSAMKSPPFQAQKTLRVNLEAPAKEYNSSSQEFSTELNSSILLNIKCISEECDHHFESKEFMMNAHFLGEHKMLPFRCILKDCGKAFPLSCELSAHVRADHASMSEYRCFLCHNQYDSHSTLISHVSLQHEQGTFQCLGCDFTSSTRALVYFHALREEHVEFEVSEGEVTIEPKEIQSTSKRANTKVQGKEKSSTSSKCTKATTSKLAHSYPCIICGKSFSQIDHLRRHNSLHKTFCPYRCLWLGCGFASKFLSKIRDHVSGHFQGQQLDKDCTSDYIKVLDYIDEGEDDYEYEEDSTL